MIVRGLPRTTALMTACCSREGAGGGARSSAGASGAGSGASAGASESDDIAVRRCAVRGWSFNKQTPVGLISFSRTAKFCSHPKEFYVKFDPLGLSAYAGDR